MQILQHMFAEACITEQRSVARGLSHVVYRASATTKTVLFLNESVCELKDRLGKEGERKINAEVNRNCEL